MVFHSQGSDPVGPIRSGRIQDIDLFGSYHGPLFVWSGGNPTVTNAIRASDLVELNASTPGMFRSVEPLVAAQPLRQHRRRSGSRPPRSRRRRRPPSSPIATTARRRSASPAAGIDVQLDAIEAHWTWDAEAGVYRREMNGQVHTRRRHGEQITTDNVVVLEMEYALGHLRQPRRPERRRGHGLRADAAAT